MCASSPGLHLFVLLPSGRRCWTIKAQTTEQSAVCYIHTSATIISVSCNNHSYSNATTFYYSMTMSAVVLLRLSFDIFICIFLFILNIVLCDIKAPFSLLFIILIFLAADLSVSCHVFLSRWMGLLCRADTMAYSEEKFFLARHSC